jgi:hypothetical protein
MILILICIGICASALMFWTMAYGPGISPDSTKYFMVARNFLARKGFYGGDISVTHYPPVYSLLLAVVSIFETSDNLQASRLLHAIFFGINIILIVYAVQKCTDDSLWASVFALLLFLSSAPLILIHSMAWSESPFIMFSLITLILFSYYSIRPSMKLLLVASTTCSLAIATRYLGVALLPSIVLSIVIFGNRSIRYKIRDTLIAMVVSCLPISVWMISNLIVMQSATDRTFVIHPIGLDHIESLIETLYFFIFPVQAPEWIQSLLIFGICSAFLLSTFKILFQKNSIFKARGDSIRFILFSLCLTFFFTNIVFLIISISFFDAHTPLDFRILAPAFLALIIAFIALTWSLFQSPEQKLIKWGLLCLAIVSIALNSRQAILRIIDIHNNGRGYSSGFWRNSETIHYLKSVSLNDSIFTNGADALRFWTEMEVMMLPNKIYPTTLNPNHDYKEQLQFLCDDVNRGNAIIIFFTNINRSYLPKLGELMSKCDLPLFMEFNDGMIFGTHVITNSK